MTSYHVPTDSLCLDDKQGSLSHHSNEDKEVDPPKTPSVQEPQQEEESNDTLEDDYSVCQERMEM